MFSNKTKQNTEDQVKEEYIVVTFSLIERPKQTTKLVLPCYQFIDMC